VEEGQNYTSFNSRSLVEMVGNVTDEALKATKIKQFLSVLAGRFFNWTGRNTECKQRNRNCNVYWT